MTTQIEQTAGDKIRSWVVCAIPRPVCKKLWNANVSWGSWAPFILGRVLNSDPKRVVRQKAN